MPGHRKLPAKFQQTTFDLEYTKDQTIKHKPQVTTFSYMIGGVQVKFPFTPYPSQLMMMAKIISTLNKEKGNALLESPTGTGKTMALLCATLAWIEKDNREIAELLEKQTLAIQNQMNQTDADILKQILSQQSSQLDLPSQLVSQENPFKKFAMNSKMIEYENVTVYEGDDEFEKQMLSKQIKDPEFKATEPFHDVPIRKPVKVYFTSRTHKQIDQAIEQLSKTGYRPRIAILGSRKHYCLNPIVQRADDQSAACIDLLRNAGCKYMKNVDKLSSKLRYEIWDIEDAVESGKALKGCPFMASRRLGETAQLIFAPYNYLLDPAIRQSMNIEVKNSIVIVDEAHNIEDTCRNTSSVELDLKKLNAINGELLGLFKRKAESKVDIIAEASHRSIFKLLQGLIRWFTSEHSGFDEESFEGRLKFYAKLQIRQLLKELELTLSDVQAYLSDINKIASELKEQDLQKGEMNPKGMTLGSCQVFESLLNACVLLWGSNVEDYKAALRETFAYRNNPPNSTLYFWCLNPAISFKTLDIDTKSIILTSGTLSPMTTFSGELETDFHAKAECPHVVKKSQVFSCILPYGKDGVELKGNYATTETLKYQDDIGLSILDIVERVPFGVLCFLPSYSMITKLMNRWKSTGLYAKLEEEKEIYCEPQNATSQKFQKSIDSFYSSNEVERGAIMFAVYRGKVSEGIDFPDNHARAVIAIGIPYPNYKDPLIKSKQAYNNEFYTKKDVLPGKEWYDIQAFRALNQALGRCIRHAGDWGAIIFLESRISSKMHGVSKWVRENTVCRNQFSNAMQDLEDFIKLNHSNSGKENSKIQTKEEKVKTSLPFEIDSKPESICIE